jgi:hypothetical protein
MISPPTMYEGGDPGLRIRQFEELVEFARDIHAAYQKTDAKREMIFLWRLRNFLERQTP